MIQSTDGRDLQKLVEGVVNTKNHFHSKMFAYSTKLKRSSRTQSGEKLSQMFDSSSLSEVSTWNSASSNIENFFQGKSRTDFFAFCWVK